MHGRRHQRRLPPQPVEFLRVEQERVDRFEISPTGPINGKKMVEPFSEAAEREAAVFDELGLDVGDSITALAVDEANHRVLVSTASSDPLKKLWVVVCDIACPYPNKGNTAAQHRNVRRSIAGPSFNEPPACLDNSLAYN